MVPGFVGILCILALSPTNGAVISASSDKKNPIVRVIQLLEGIAKEIEKDGKAEEGLYDAYVCWGKSVIAEKQAENADLKTKIESIRVYVSDLTAGRVEVDQEAVVLKAEILQLNEELLTLGETRNQTIADYTAAKGDMDSAVAALDTAAGLLKNANAPSELHELNLLSVQHQTLQGLQQQETNLRNAVQLGHRFLNKVDALFLERVLTGQVPKRDHKNLGRRDTVSQYKDRSTKIQTTMANMRNTFGKKLGDAKIKDYKDNLEYQSLKGGKEKNKKTKELDLADKRDDSGAKGIKIGKLNNEMKLLKQSVKDNEDTIKEVQENLDEKKEDWRKRIELRKGEIAAIEKAIHILGNDDSRDTFRRSFKSAGYSKDRSASASSFLQTEQTSRRARAAAAAADALRNAAVGPRAPHMISLAQQLHSMTDEPGIVAKQFQIVQEQIDKLIGALNGEDTKDNEIKEQCEATRATRTRESLKLSRDIDDNNDIIARLNEDNGLLDKDIKTAEDEITKLKNELDKAKKNQEDEHKEWQQNDKDDRAAMALTAQARDYMRDWYQDNTGSASLLSTHDAGHAKAGPPPSTFGKSYAAKDTESGGIVVLLTMIETDIDKDRIIADADDKAGKAAFDKFKKETDDRVQVLDNLINDKQEEKGDNVEEKVELEGKNKNKKETIADNMKSVKKDNPDCEYYEVNYPQRKENRRVEREGLKTAKALMTVAPEKAEVPTLANGGLSAPSMLLLQART